MNEKISIDSILNEIRSEQQDLKQKKDSIKNIISKLTSNLESILDTQTKKPYGQIKLSSQLQAEMIKSLISAHDLDIKISNTLLKSYEQVIRLLQNEEKDSEIDYNLLNELSKMFGDQISTTILCQEDLENQLDRE